MHTYRDNVDIFYILKNPKRRFILLVLEKVKRATFTELMKLMGINHPGTLGFHLKNLSDLIEKDEIFYKLSTKSEAIVKALKSKRLGVVFILSIMGLVALNFGSFPVISLMRGLCISSLLTLSIFLTLYRSFRNYSDNIEHE